MDYTPPPQIERPAEIPQAQKQKQEQLIISIDEALYNKEKHQATIKMSDAFQKSHVIQGYNGADITLVYNDTAVKLADCPPVRVPTKDVRRDISLFNNTVTLTISNISQDLAEKIRETMCLLIDTETVKKVSNPNYVSPDAPKAPYSSVNQ